MLTKTSFTIRLHPNDDVVIARQQLVSGTTLIDENVKVSGLIPPGHKVATRAIRQGEPVKRYDQIIGFAKGDIVAGDHVHTHNLVMKDFNREYEFCVDARPVAYYPLEQIPVPTRFMVIRTTGASLKYGFRNFKWYR